MKQLKRDLWDLYDCREPGEWFCITTNGIVKKNGHAVMGAGCAGEAATRFKDLPEKLGNFLSVCGNRLFPFPEYQIITFPTKHNWMDDSNLELIDMSCAKLLEAMNKLDVAFVYLPQPGTGKGNLSWNDVRPVIEKYFLNDDRLIILSK